MIRLVNKARTSLTFNLTRDLAPMRRLYARTVTDKSGEARREDVRVVIADSVTLLHGESRGGFPDSVVRCPEVANLIAARMLGIEVEPDAVSPSETRAEPTETLMDEDAAPRRKDTPAKGDRRSA